MSSNKETQVVLAASHQYSGPLPQAGELVKYNEACPNAADRIITMAEEEAKHRHVMEKQEEDNKWKTIKYSVVGAVLCVAMLSGVIIYAIHEKATIAAVATAIAAIASVTGLFVYQRKKNEKQN